MNTEDIIRMAREVYGPHKFSNAGLLLLERFASLVADAEREACAKVCDDWAKTSYLSEAKSCAAAIRARGNT